MQLSSSFGFAVAGIMTAFILGGCSGGTDHPTSSAGSIVDPGPAAEPGPTATPGSTVVACAEEGATARCAQLGARNGQYVLCGRGTKTCKGGSWSECAAPEGETEFYPATAACDPCDTDGVTRVCKISLPNQGNVHACAQGKETCTGGYWSNCK